MSFGVCAKEIDMKFETYVRFEILHESSHAIFKKGISCSRSTVVEIVVKIFTKTVQDF